MLSHSTATLTSTPSIQIQGHYQPLLITIGPQCAGKTTYLKKIPNVLDIAIDDQDNTYEPVDIKTIFQIYESKTFPRAEKMIHKRRLYRDRVGELMETEQILLLLIFSSAISFDTFTEKVKVCMKEESSCNFFLLLCSQLYNTTEPHKLVTTKKVDVFIPEAIRYSAKQATMKLQTALQINQSTTTVCWGNTNLNTRDYKKVMVEAESAGRPVYFIRWGYELPNISFEELMRRNIIRLLQTGKYIPMATLANFYSRAEEQIESYAVLPGYNLPINSTNINNSTGNDTAPLLTNPTSTSTVLKRVKSRDTKRKVNKLEEDDSKGIGEKEKGSGEKDNGRGEKDNGSGEKEKGSGEKAGDIKGSREALTMDCTEDANNINVKISSSDIPEVFIEAVELEDILRESQASTVISNTPTPHSGDIAVINPILRQSCDGHSEQSIRTTATATPPTTTIEATTAESEKPAVQRSCNTKSKSSILGTLWRCLHIFSCCTLIVQPTSAFHIASRSKGYVLSKTKFTFSTITAFTTLTKPSRILSHQTPVMKVWTQWRKWRKMSKSEWIEQGAYKRFEYNMEASRNKLLHSKTRRFNTYQEGEIEVGAEMEMSEEYKRNIARNVAEEKQLFQAIKDIYKKN